MRLRRWPKTSSQSTSTISMLPVPTHTEHLGGTERLSQGMSSFINYQIHLDSHKQYTRLFIRPRVLKDVSEIDTSAEIFGSRSTLPIGIAPSAMQRLAGGAGELDVAKAAAGMGLNLTLSSQSTTSLEDVMQAKKDTETGVGAPPSWMQIYLNEDMQKSVPLIKRAEGKHDLNIACKNGELTIQQPLVTRHSFSQLTHLYWEIAWRREGQLSFFRQA
jgi:hypothetical protein